MKLKKKKKVVAQKKKRVVKKKLAPIAKSVVEKSPAIRNKKLLDNAAFLERKERQYKFDQRLVPYYLGGDTKEGNLALRTALIKLGETSAMTELFEAMKAGNLGYRDDARDVFIKALYAVIKGHDQQGLTHIGEDDIKAIHDNNLRKFKEFWDAVAKANDDDFAGFTN